MRLKIKFETEEIHGEFHEELVVMHDDNEIAREDDRMEPEDATFGRSLQWIAPLLEKVYKLGVEDGYNECFVQEL